MLNILESRREKQPLLVFAMFFVISTITMITLTTSIASAQASADASKKAPKRTTINFEDQLIEGRTQKPELFVLLQNRMNNSRRLFKLRENFLPEMRKTAEDVGRAETQGNAETLK